MCLNIDPPIISIDPPQSPYNVTVGSRLQLYCSAHGLPLPKVQWYINDSPINQQPPESYLVPTVSPHNTVYTCVATNNAGNITHTVSKNITVYVEGTYIHIANNYVYKRQQTKCITPSSVLIETPVNMEKIVVLYYVHHCTM